MKIREDLPSQRTRWRFCAISFVNSQNMELRSDGLKGLASGSCMTMPLLAYIIRPKIGRPTNRWDFGWGAKGSRRSSVKSRLGTSPCLTLASSMYRFNAGTSYSSKSTGIYIAKAVHELRQAIEERRKMKDSTQQRTLLLALGYACNATAVIGGNIQHTQSYANLVIWNCSGNWHVPRDCGASANATRMLCAEDREKSKLLSPEDAQIGCYEVDDDVMCKVKDVLRSKIFVGFIYYRLFLTASITSFLHSR